MEFLLEKSQQSVLLRPTNISNQYMDSKSLVPNIKIFFLLPRSLFTFSKILFISHVNNLGSFDLGLYLYPGSEERKGIWERERMLSIDII